MSVTGIRRAILELISEMTDDSPLRRISVEDMTSVIVSDAALEGDSIARQAFEQTAEILGIQIADSAAHSDPEAYLLLGGLSKAGNNLLKLTIATMLRNLFNTYKGNVKLLLSDTPSNLAVLSPDYQ